MRKSMRKSIRKSIRKNHASKSKRLGKQSIKRGGKVKNGSICTTNIDCESNYCNTKSKKCEPEVSLLSNSLDPRLLELMNK